MLLLYILPWGKKTWDKGIYTPARETYGRGKVLSRMSEL